jgi:hypothetical protein
VEHRLKQLIQSAAAVSLPGLEVAYFFNSIGELLLQC